MYNILHIMCIIDIYVGGPVVDVSNRKSFNVENLNNQYVSFYKYILYYTYCCAGTCPFHPIRQYQNPKSLRKLFFYYLLHIFFSWMCSNSSSISKKIMIIIIRDYANIILYICFGRIDNMYYIVPIYIYTFLITFI